MQLTDIINSGKMFPKQKIVLRTDLKGVLIRAGIVMPQVKLMPVLLASHVALGCAVSIPSLGRQQKIVYVRYLGPCHQYGTVRLLISAWTSSSHCG